MSLVSGYSNSSSHFKVPTFCICLGSDAQFCDNHLTRSGFWQEKFVFCSCYLSSWVGGFSSSSSSLRDLVSRVLPEMPVATIAGSLCKEKGLIHSSSTDQKWCLSLHHISLAKSVWTPNSSRWDPGGRDPRHYWPLQGAEPGQLIQPENKTKVRDESFV